MHIYILPQCSTTAASVLNSAGMDAQFERSCCAISRGILSYPARWCWFCRIPSYTSHFLRFCGNKIDRLRVQSACENWGQLLAIKATTSFQKCAAAYRKRQSAWRWLPLSVTTVSRRYYHSTGLFAKTCYFVLFRPVLCCSLLICPVGCYALLVVGARGDVLSSRWAGGGGAW